MQPACRAAATCFGKPGVAIVVAEGEIVGGKQAPGSIGGESTAALIRAAREDRKTKALVLRVNSPGGEVYAAEQIRREMELTRDGRHSGGGVDGRRGGQRRLLDLDECQPHLAEPNTITGSIGIFGMYYTVPNTLAKLGIQSDGVGTGPMAGAFDITRPLDPNVGAVIQAIIDKGYHDFVGGVAKARGKSFADIDAIAQGRVWTGQQALQRGLVDQLGGLDEAVVDASQVWPSWARTIRCSYAGNRHRVGFERFLIELQHDASMRVMQSWGIRLPDLVRAVAGAGARTAVAAQRQGRHAATSTPSACAVRAD